MADYQKMYHVLFNRITTVIGELQEAQIRAEEIYMEGDDTPIHIERDDEDKDT